MNKNETLPTTVLLDQIKRRFYDPHPEPKRYYKDKKMLLYAITWPAKWLDKRALPIPAKDYQKLIVQRLDDIAKHGDPRRFQKHFPTYLLKTIQDWFKHHGDKLYNELKHVRNQLYSVRALLDTCTTAAQQDIVTPMAKAHAILMSQSNKPKKDTRQLKLF